MIKTGWTKRAVVTYSLLQIPGWLLAGLVLMLSHMHFSLPAWAGWLIFILWLLKDTILFFFLWPAYDNQSADVYTLIGKQAVATTDLAPSGQVRLNGQTWKARADPAYGPIPAGGKVEVADRHGLLLIVRPAHKESRG